MSDLLDTALILARQGDTDALVELLQNAKRWRSGGQGASGTTELTEAQVVQALGYRPATKAEAGTGEATVENALGYVPAQSDGGLGLTGNEKNKLSIAEEAIGAREAAPALAGDGLTGGGGSALAVDSTVARTDQTETFGQHVTIEKGLDVYGQVRASNRLTLDGGFGQALRFDRRQNNNVDSLYEISASYNIDEIGNDHLRFHTESGDPLLAVGEQGVLTNNDLFVKGSATFYGDSVKHAGDVIPTSNYSGNVGLPQQKWLSIHAAELRVEKYVTGENIVTRGDRLTVAQHATILAGPGSSSGDNNYYTVDTNSLRGGDRVHIQGGGKVEFMRVHGGFGDADSGKPYETVTVDGQTAYKYRFERNLDGTGYSEGDWGEGDVMVNTGNTGDAMIDLYAINPITDAAQGVTAGPTIAGLVRQSKTWDDIPPRWAVGNLYPHYDYGSDAYGLAAGDYGSAWIGVDDSNGVRLMHGSDKKIWLERGGDAYFDGTVYARDGVIESSVTIGGNSVGDLATVNDVFGGDYSDLSGRPSLGSVASLNEITSTYIKNGTIVAANIASGEVTADKIDVDDLFAVNADIAGSLDVAPSGVINVGSTSMRSTGIISDASMGAADGVGIRGYDGPTTNNTLQWAYVGDTSRALLQSANDVLISADQNIDLITTGSRVRTNADFELFTDNTSKTNSLIFSGKDSNGDYHEVEIYLLLANNNASLYMTTDGQSEELGSIYGIGSGSGGGPPDGGSGGGGGGSDIVY